MRDSPSLKRRCLLLIVIISPVLLGSEFRCVAVSNPSVITARIDQLDPITPQVGEIMNVSGSGSGASPLDFTWDFGDGASLAFGSQAAHVFTAPGSYQIVLTIRDSAGHIARDSAQISVLARVAPLMPTAMVVSDSIAGLPVEFFAEANDAEEGAPMRFDWRFSDGQSASGSRVAATFPKAGSYLAFLTVTDDAGAIAVTQVPFEVSEAVRDSRESTMDQGISAR